MATKVIMPKLSPTMEEGQLSRWLKKEGDKVSMGEPLAEIDTDKATMEMQALGNGVLRKILIQDGESAPLGQLIAIIGEPDEDISALVGQAETAQPKEAAQPEAAATAPEKTEVTPSPEPGAKAKSEDETQAEPTPARQTSADDKAGRRDGTDVAGGNGSQKARLIVSPLAARMAAESGIDLRSVTGSGPGGRIIKRDVEELVGGRSAASE